MPIVFAQVIDPVGGGFVDESGTAGRQRHRIYQFEYGLGGKWLELLKQIAPGVTRAAVFVMPTNSPGPRNGVQSKPWRRRSGWS